MKSTGGWVAARKGVGRFVAYVVFVLVFIKLVGVGVQTKEARVRRGDEESVEERCGW
jgi:hypothetical protein